MKTKAQKTEIGKGETLKPKNGNAAFTRQQSPGFSRCRLKTAFLGTRVGSRFSVNPFAACSRAAFTLIEIMIVVVIIGILAATIIPQFMGTTNDAKVSAARGHIAELGTAVERFNIHMDRYPSVEEGLKVLVEPPAGEQTKWRGPYIAQLRDDPWGNPYQYRAPGVRHPTTFDIWSRAKDGADGGDGEGADIGNW